MERESFIFYKSFYEAIAGLKDDIKIEVLTAIIEYALYGKHPEDLRPVAKGMFTLMKPNIDVNTIRYQNGKKGGAKSKKAKSKDGYDLTFEQELERMRADEDWQEAICADFNITHAELDKRLSRFIDRCNDDKKRKLKERHDSYEDCLSHMRYWMAKAYPSTQIESTPKPFSEQNNYEFNGGFGGKDI